MRRRNLSLLLAWIVLLIVLVLVPLFVTQNYILHILVIAGVNVVLASSLRFIYLSGNLSLGHGGLTSIGAYFSALTVMKLNLPFWLTLPLAGVASMVVALIFGTLFTRLKGIYFGMVTLFLTMVIQYVITEWRGVTGGAGGLANIPRPNAIEWLGLDFAAKNDYYYLILFVAGISLLIMYLLEASRFGITLSSVKESDTLAESVGVNTQFYKVLAFGIGGFFAGIAGSFLAHYYTMIEPITYSMMLSIHIFIFLVVGGRNRLLGPVIGAFALTVIPELSRGLKQYEPFVFAAVLLVVIMFMPEGLVSLPQRIKAIFAKRVGRPPLNAAVTERISND